MKKKTFYFLFILIFVFINNFIPVHSQTNSSKSAFNFSLNNVILDKNQYNSGDEIVGSFEVKNLASTQESMGYDIALAGDYQENTLAGKFYGVTEIVEVKNIEPGETRKIDFKYIIPKGIGGTEMGIQVQAYNTSGVPVLWRDSERINILNGVGQIEVENIYIKSNNGKEESILGSGVGPVMYKDSAPNKLIAGIDYVGAKEGKYLVQPKIYIYDFLKDNENVYVGTLNSFEVSGEDGKYEFELPNLDYKPSVYLAKVILMDDFGNIRSSELFYRYIVAGNLVNISDVLISSVKPLRNEKIQFTVNYTGSPTDMLRAAEQGEDFRNTEYVNVVKIKAKDSEGNIVLEQEREFSTENDKQIIFDHDFKKFYEKLNLEVEIKDKDGNLLDYFDKEVKFEKSETFSFKYRFMFLLDYVLFFLLISLITSFFYFKRKKFIKFWLIFALLLTIVFVIYKFSNNHQSVFAATSPAGVDYVNYDLTYEWRTPGPGCPYMLNGASITSNEPYDNYVLNSNQGSVYMTGTVGYVHCTNTPMTATLSGDIDKTVLGYSNPVSFNDGSGNGAYLGRSNQYAIGPFTAPYTVGDYRMSVKVNLANGGCNAEFRVEKPYKIKTTAQCGQNAKTYTATNFSWPGTTNNDFCANGSVLVGSVPTYPDPSNSSKNISWTCSGGTGGQDASCNASIPALDPLTVSCSSSKQTLQPGDTVVWTAYPTGGMGKNYYKVEWSGNAYESNGLGYFELNGINTSNEFIDIKVEKQDNYMTLGTTTLNYKIESKGYNSVKFFRKIISKSSNLCGTQSIGTWTQIGNTFTNNSTNYSTNSFTQVLPNEKCQFEIAAAGYLNNVIKKQDTTDFVYTMKSKYNPNNLTNITNRTYTQQYNNAGSYKTDVKVTDLFTGNIATASCSINVCNNADCGPCPGQVVCPLGECANAINECRGELSAFGSAPKIIEKGESCNLSWVLEGNFNSCKLNGVDVSTTSGEFNVSGLESTTKYTLECVDGLGTKTKEAQCIVNPSAIEF